MGEKRMACPPPGIRDNLYTSFFSTTIDSITTSSGLACHPPFVGSL